MIAYSAVRLGLKAHGHTHFTVDGLVTLCGTSLTRTFSLDDVESHENPDYFHQAHGPIDCPWCQPFLKQAHESATNK